MGAIIRMSSKTFVEDFIKNENYKNFTFLLASNDIKTRGNYDNIYSMKVLIPPVSSLRSYVEQGVNKKYIKKYIEYLETRKMETILSVIVKAAVVEEQNVVILCSEEESEYEYTKILCKHIESVFKVPTYSYKKFKKEEHPGELKNREKTLKILKDLIGKENMKPTTLTPKQLKNTLKDHSKKELIRMCKSSKIKVDDSMTKTEIIDKYVKKTL